MTCTETCTSGAETGFTQFFLEALIRMFIRFAARLILTAHSRASDAAEGGPTMDGPVVLPFGSGSLPNRATTTSDSVLS